MSLSSRALAGFPDRCIDLMDACLAGGLWESFRAGKGDYKDVSEISLVFHNHLEGRDT